MTSAADAWANYWRTGVLTTFGDKPTYQGELREFWLQFFRDLGDRAVVVDLGAGNGALEEIAAGFCADSGARFVVHAVDAADLAPSVASDPGRCEIVWHPRTRNEATGLDTNSVDAVIGSYAFEYGDETATVDEIARILRRPGRCRFLMHHADSVVIRDSAGELAVLESALHDGGLFDAAEAFLREFGSTHKPGQFEKLKNSGRLQPFLQRLDRAASAAAAVIRTPNGRAALEELVQGIFSLISPPVLFEPKEALLERLAAARREYRANRARLADMQRAKVDAARLQRIAGLFEQRGAQVHAEAFRVAGFEAPVAWSVSVVFS